MSSIISITETPSRITISEPSSVSITETPSVLSLNEIDSTLTINQTNNLTISETDSRVTVNQTSTEIIEVGIAGPQGVDSVSDEAIRTDDVAGTTIYKGWAAIGTENTDAGWKIARYTFVGEDITLEWADGNNNYDNIWDNRLALSYD